jgi:hypothetical protein
MYINVETCLSILVLFLADASQRNKKTRELLIDWYLMPILAVFQLCRGVNKFYILNFSTTQSLKVKHICL